MSDFVIANGVLEKYVGEGENPVIPEEVTGLGDSAFQFSKIKSIKLPGKLKSIGARAFAGCHDLKELVIPDSVTSIGKEAFRNSGLETVKLPKKLKALKEELFTGAELNSIDIPEGVTKIERAAFRSCRKLSRVHLPGSLKSIGDFAFEDDERLEEINVSPSVSVSGGAFNFCAGLADKDGFIVINGELFKSPAMYRSYKLVLPDSVRVIKSYSADFRLDLDGVAWYHNRDEFFELLEKKVGSVIEIPASVEIIEPFAFLGDIKEIISHAKAPFGMMVFNEDCKIKNLSVPEGTEISDMAFGLWPEAMKKVAKLNIRYL